ncbi:ABC transporter permease [Bacillus salacetis]|uniref:Putative hemin transport system permease protein HrtB n=1 Tax=Bacillus salacetis TaxID=2315464 RepID=A0A3A1QQ37_9BACI|nr:FtsX-like permease family protein [Bacillus salacetis]RIW29204.1 ABC transporter permease [Bacillus salacetis]
MFLAFKELGQSKLRYTLISLIMIAVLFLVFFISGLANGLGFGDSAAVRNLAADHVVLNEEAEGAIIGSNLSEDQFDEIEAKLDRDFSPLSVTMMTSFSSNEEEVDVTYFSVDTESYPDIEIAEGKNINELTGNEVIIDESIKNDGFSLKDTVTDKNTGKELIIAGFSKDQLYSNIPVAYASLEAGLSMNPNQGTSYNAVLYSGEKVDVDGFETLTIGEAVKSIPGYTETQGSLKMIVVFLFIISAFVSTVFFYVITIHKLNQLGVLKAIGATTGYIARSIMIQVGLLTMIGLVFSGSLVYGMTRLIPEDMPFRLTPELMLGTAGLFLALNLLGALLSVYQVAKTDALEAIGRAE